MQRARYGQLPLFKTVFGNGVSRQVNDAQHICCETACWPLFFTRVLPGCAVHSAQLKRHTSVLRMNEKGEIFSFLSKVWTKGLYERFERDSRRDCRVPRGREHQGTKRLSRLSRFGSQFAWISRRPKRIAVPPGLLFSLHFYSGIRVKGSAQLTPPSSAYLSHRAPETTLSAEATYFAALS